MKRTLIVANWKMNLNTSQASLLVHRLQERVKIYRNIEVVLAPNMMVLQPLSVQIDRRKFRLAAQNAYHKDEGPYTGEVSFTMLQDLVHYVIVGHSDRRHKFGEDLDTVREKVAACVRNDMIPILCVGETMHEKAAGETMQVVHDQVTSALADVTADEVKDMVIAYEPVWALSSGKDYKTKEVPTPEMMTKVAAHIRKQVSSLYGKRAAEGVRVLYGGSTNASNATDILSAEGIDGLLVGGASLNYHEFSGITDAAYRLHHADGEKDGS